MKTEKHLQDERDNEDFESQERALLDQIGSDLEWTDTLQEDGEFPESIIVKKEPLPIKSVQKNVNS